MSDGSIICGWCCEVVRVVGSRSVAAMLIFDFGGLVMKVDTNFDEGLCYPSCY